MLDRLDSHGNLLSDLRKLGLELRPDQDTREHRQSQNQDAGNGQTAYTYDGTDAPDPRYVGASCERVLSVKSTTTGN